MTRTVRLATVLVFALAASAALAEVVVLKGGTVIRLKSAPVVRGNNVLLTRTDGTVLSVPVAEIDRNATAAARAAAPVAPSPTPSAPTTLADAARAAKEVPKARVRITDADVAHGEAASPGTDAAAVEAGAAVDASAGAGRVEVADYSQEKSGDALIVRGSLKNPGATPATNVRMTVTAIDQKGQAIVSGEAGASNGTIAPGGTAAFTVSLGVGARPVGSIRFTPRWSSAAPAATGSTPEGDAAARASGSASSAGAAGAAGSAAASSATPAPAAARPSPPPGPAPTPYGQGSLYAAPAPNAPSQAPADGKTGYLPGASSPSNQPKPPN